MKDKIISLLEKEGISKELVSQALEVPKEPAFGDYAFPCFSLAKELKKSPVEIAKELASKIKSPELEKVEAKGPYLNFFINRSSLAQEVIKQILKEKDRYGSSKIGSGKTIVIDYSAPNIGKPMHVGHIRSTLIGDSLKRIFLFQGYNVKGINYLGDIGLHVGKLIVACELWLDKTSLKKDPIKELFRLYVKFCEYEKSELDNEEEDYEGNEWTKKAKEKLKLIEEGDKKTIEIWRKIEKSSLEGFNRIYKILGINFDETTGQSRFSEKGKSIIKEAVKKGIAVKEKDSEAVFIELSPLPKKYILRSNGTASYITQDIGAAIERFEKFKFEKMVYVTDYRQQLHFQQLFAILARIGLSFSSKCIHIPFGTLKFGNEIIATRAGKVILLEEVLEKTIEKARDEIQKRNSGGEPEKIALAALKYSALKTEPIRDAVFSWEKAMHFEGDTGPYLLYTYARARNILRKANYKKAVKFSAGSPDNLEKNLISQLGQFPQGASNAFQQYAPNLIANYSFQIAQAFNEIYHKNQVIGSEEESFRLMLVDAFSQVLKNALHLLGIRVLEKM